MLNWWKYEVKPIVSSSTLMKQKYLSKRYKQYYLKDNYFKTIYLYISIKNLPIYIYSVLNILQHSYYIFACIANEYNKLKRDNFLSH